MRREKQITRLWKPVVTGAVAGLLALAAAEFALVRPVVAENDERRAALELLRIENSRTEQMVADYDEFVRQADAVEQQYQEAIASVPTEAELAAALEDLERVTAASGVSLVRFTPKPRREPSRNESAAVSSTIEAQPLSVVVRTSFRDFETLLTRLSTYDRLLTIDAFTLRTSQSGQYTIDATIDLECYFKHVAPEANGATRPTT